MTRLGGLLTHFKANFCGRLLFLLVTPVYGINRFIKLF